MKAVVTGASGFVGGNLALELIQRGHSVRATRRSSSSVTHLGSAPIEWVDADLGDESALAAAFGGADAVFHCAALVSVRKRITPEIALANVDGARNVVRAAKAAGVQRLVHCSTVNAVGLSEDGKPSNEQSQWNFDRYGMDDAYTITKRKAEDVVAQEGTDLDWVIVNPTYMIGPYDPKPTSGKLLLDVARQKLPGNFPGANNFVDVRDVARGMIVACEKGRRGERYILGGENLPYREIIARIARVAGVPPPSRNVPRWVANVVGWLGDAEERLLGREPLLNSTTVRFGFCSTFQFSSEKAERELGHRHGPLDVAIADAFAYFRATGKL